jgi:hypothetical protein
MIYKMRKILPMLIILYCGVMLLSFPWFRFNDSIATERLINGIGLFLLIFGSGAAFYTLTILRLDSTFRIVQELNVKGLEKVELLTRSRIDPVLDKISEYAPLRLLVDYNEVNESTVRILEKLRFHRQEGCIDILITGMTPTNLESQESEKESYEKRVFLELLRSVIRIDGKCSVRKNSIFVGRTIIIAKDRIWILMPCDKNGEFWIWLAANAYSQLGQEYLILFSKLWETGLPVEGRVI